VNAGLLSMWAEMMSNRSGNRPQEPTGAASTSVLQPRVPEPRFCPEIRGGEGR